MNINLLHDSDFSDAAEEAAIELTLSMLRSERYSLFDVAVDPVPIVYMLFVDDFPYRNWCFYVGHTANARRRVNDHRKTLSDASQIRPGGVTVAWMPAATHAIGAWAELTLLEHLAPVGNFVLPGIGCKQRGTVRDAGGISKFRTMHPKAGMVIDVDKRRELRRSVVEHLTSTAPPRWVVDGFSL